MVDLGVIRQHVVVTWGVTIIALEAEMSSTLDSSNEIKQRQVWTAWRNLKSAVLTKQNVWAAIRLVLSALIAALVRIAIGWLAR